MPVASLIFITSSIYATVIAIEVVALVIAGVGFFMATMAGNEGDTSKMQQHALNASKWGASWGAIGVVIAAVWLFM